MNIGIKVVGEIVLCIPVFAMSQTSSGLMVIKKYLEKLCRDAVLVDMVMTGQVKTKASVIPEAFVDLLGYETLLLMELRSTLQSWSKAKWVSIAATVFFIWLSGFLLGETFYAVSILVAVVGAMVQSKYVKQAALDEVGALAKIVRRWFIYSDLHCAQFCKAPENLKLFGNMYFVARRLEVEENY